MRNRVYFNVREKNLSVLDYKTNKVTKKVTQAYLTNALFVVHKSGNKRVREEGRKNVHAFVNGIIQSKPPLNFDGYAFVRYNPYEMDFFQYRRVINDEPVWLPVDKHWIGNVWIFVDEGRPNMYADIDKLADTNNDKSIDTNEQLMVIKGDSFQKAIFPKGQVRFSFLNKKRKIIENKNKIIDKTVAI